MHESEVGAGVKKDKSSRGRALVQHVQLVQSTDVRRKRRMEELAASLSTSSLSKISNAGTPIEVGSGAGKLNNDHDAVSTKDASKSKDEDAGKEGNHEDDEDPTKLKQLAYSESVYSIEEETLRNDLSMAYINTGRRPQNMLQGCDLDERFSEYPKLAKLLDLHSALVAGHAHPPTYLSTDLRQFQLPSLLPTKFDCILIDPPLEEYFRTYPARFLAAPSVPSDQKSDKLYWTWDEIASLPVPQITSTPGFIWLWVGSGKADENGISGLDKGREILAKWGYRRCEDIVWLKTNKRKASLADEPPTNTLLTHSKEHCLMGIRGTVRRSTDGHFVHCNVDTDVIVWEGDEQDPLHKPPELYNIIENFCLGTRRLELFGSSKNLRPGWLTLGTELERPSKDGKNENVKQTDSVSAQAYSKEAYDLYFQHESNTGGANLVPTTSEVESLRPRSPGGPNRSSITPMPGVKNNPQGIGRHTNRSATPSASQQLEYERRNQEVNRVQKNVGLSLQMKQQRDIQQHQQQQLQHQIQLAQYQQQQQLMMQQMAQQAQQQAFMMNNSMTMGGYRDPMSMLGGFSQIGMGMPNMQMSGMGMEMGMLGMDMGTQGLPQMHIQNMTPQQQQMMLLQQQQQGALNMNSNGLNGQYWNSGEQYGQQQFF